MVIFIKRQQGSGSESNALSYSPSSFAETFEALHEARGKKVETLAHCHGDPIIDNLRIARARMERSVKDLRKCTTEARQEEERYDIGSYLEGVVDELEYEWKDSMDSAWFERRSEHVMCRVVDAEETDDDEYPTPEEETWKTFRELSKALKEHAHAIGELADAEAAAKPSLARNR